MSKIDGRFYWCEGCKKWQPFIGRDVSCDCGHITDFDENQLLDLEEALAREEAAELRQILEGE